MRHLPTAGNPASPARPRARIALGCAAGLVVLLVGVTTAAAQTADLPFLPGEDLRYSVHLGRFGGVGEGSMRVEGTERVRGRDVYRLAFDFSGRVAGMARVEDRTRSWLDPARMESLRYEKTERSPLGNARERVEIHPEHRRWTAEDGGEHVLGGASPLDELSFLYFIRTLDLRPGDSHTLHRHFDPDRNPVRIRAVRRERIRVPAGEFDTVLVEMRVNDPRRFNGSGVLRLYITDDRRRLPVRIETRMPVVGTTALELNALPRVALVP